MTITATIAKVEDLVGFKLDASDRREIEFRIRSHGTRNVHKLAAIIEYGHGIGA